eukprot:TRINITY_DN3140_c0_g1_i1.p2 TRINITY_DN3140_c0_g1~~TRINITY_DN3140_c0_g1_i1.p2  ORF type:complete len:270 (+),score=69.48 TRINITY_DN3140_c0_g1_i1:1280-2089(+)
MDSRQEPPLTPFMVLDESRSDSDDVPSSVRTGARLIPRRPIAPSLSETSSSLPLPFEPLRPYVQSSDPIPIAAHPISPPVDIPRASSVPAHVFYDSSPPSPSPPSSSSLGASPSPTLDTSELECSLCFRLFYQPVTTLCGHSFCKSCIFSALKYSPQCPLCRFKLGASKGDGSSMDMNGAGRYSVNIVINNLIEKHFPEENREREEEEEEIWLQEKRRRDKRTDTRQDEDADQPTVTGSGVLASSPLGSLSWLVPSIRTCTVIMSCGGF